MALLTAATAACSVQHSNASLGLQHVHTTCFLQTSEGFKYTLEALKVNFPLPGTFSLLLTCGSRLADCCHFSRFLAGGMEQDWESKLAARDDFSKQQKAAIRGRLLALDDAKANGFFRGDDEDIRIALETILPESTGKSIPVTRHYRLAAAPLHAVGSFA